MPKAIRFYKPGGPDVLVWEVVAVGKPGEGEALSWARLRISVQCTTH